MAGSDEQMRILRMIEERKLTAEEGAKLLAALRDGAQTAGNQKSGTPADAGKWLRIRVTDIASGQSKASVEIPLGLMDAGMKIGAQFAPQVDGVDLTHVLDAIRSGASGRIIDVTNEEQGEHVEIFVD